MNRDQRQRQMLGSLPLLLQDGRNVGDFFGRIADLFSGGAEVGGVEYGLTRLLRSRWHREAEGWTGEVTAGTDEATARTSELGRIGVLFGFPPARGEHADAFRRRIVEFIALHRDGLTTASAVLRLVALVYQAEDTPTITWRGDRVAVAEFFAHAGGERAAIHVELHDNPVLPAETRFRGAKPGQHLVLRNAGLDPARPEITLRPIDRPARVPVLIDLDSGQRLIYVGVVQSGATLTLRHGLAPLLDGAPQSAPVLLVNPFSFDAASAAFGARDRIGARFSLARRDLALPLLGPGENRWRYDVLPRDVLRGLLVAWPELTALEALADDRADAPAADVEAKWLESTPAAIALRIPADRVPRAFAGDLTTFVRELEWALARGSAAGVRARVELAFPHVRERIELVDQLHVSASSRLVEAARIDDPPVRPRQVIRLSDALAGPTDDLACAGRFNATPFNISRFT